MAGYLKAFWLAVRTITLMVQRMELLEKRKSNYICMLKYVALYMWLYIFLKIHILIFTDLNNQQTGWLSSFDMLVFKLLKFSFIIRGLWHTKSNTLNGITIIQEPKN